LFLGSPGQELCVQKSGPDVVVFLNIKRMEKTNPELLRTRKIGLAKLDDACD
jgi:hypothetical protein